MGSDCHVATSPRRDVSTSRRGNVATSARDLHPSILKYGGSEFEVSGGVRGKVRNSKADRHRLRGSARDLYRFSFVRYYFGY